MAGVYISQGSIPQCIETGACKSEEKNRPRDVLLYPVATTCVKWSAQKQNIYISRLTEKLTFSLSETCMVNGRGLYFGHLVPSGAHNTGRKVEFPAIQDRAKFPVHFPTLFRHLS